MGRVSDNGIYPPKKYNKVHLYIVDDIDRHAPVEDFDGQARSTHEINCDLVLGLIKNYALNYTLHHKVFPAGARKRDFWEYWRGEVRSKTKGDLLIIYYHGLAGCEEEEYTWILSQNPSISINAYDFIGIVNDGRADCVFLLDCWTHTRITSKWKREEGNTEIIARPQPMADSRGRITTHDSDFTRALIRNVRSFVECIRVDYRRHHAMESIPDIMALDKDIYSNPIRIWLDRTWADDDRVVRRVKIDPDYTRITGKLEFWAVQIQGPEVDIMGRLVPEADVDMEDDDAENEVTNGGYDIVDEGVELDDANNCLVDSREEADTTDD